MTNKNIHKIVMILMFVHKYKPVLENEINIVKQCSKCVEVSRRAVETKLKFWNRERGIL